MHWKRWAVVFVVGGCIGSYALHAQNSVAGNSASCGLGLPPDANGYASDQARKEVEAQKNGFLSVCESDLERFDITFKSLATVVQGLEFQPVNLNQTLFTKFESIGGSAENVNGKKSRLYRGFKMPDGHTLTLFEHDMSVDGSSIWRDPKDEPERVNGLPARLVVFQTSSGKAISQLSWKEGRRYYELWINANVSRGPLREQLFALASSIPVSVPACSNELSSRPIVLNSDGSPASVSLPEVITNEQLKTLSESRRPCN
jgi:hypothetical protein